jgi:hypothetical protein
MAPAKVVQLGAPPNDTQLKTDAFAELNDSYAVTLAGNKVVVPREFDETDLKTGAVRPSWMLMRASDFHTWTAPFTITLQGSDSNQSRTYPISKLWIASDQRRQYAGIEFAPNRDLDGKYNLWRGFAVEPEEGDCSLYLNHLRDNVCQGNREHYDWLIGWMAQMVRQPEVKLGTSVVLIGEEGTGKTKVGQVLGSLFPEHYLMVAHSSHLTGTFNAHMAKCLLLHADESFWAGDKDAEGTLKIW